jgi:NADPH:quinone reductase-like Zn-dependent oxidoreductase
MREVVLSEPFAQSEVDRYSYRMPGQATAYDYGYVKLRALKTQAVLDEFIPAQRGKVAAHQALAWSVRHALRAAATISARPVWAADNRWRTAMRAYQILPGDGIDGLQCVDFPHRELGNGEVRIRVHAVSLNYRDLMVASGNYLVTVDDPIIPCSDGAGEVVATGPGVTRIQPGDRVAASFFPYWQDGPTGPDKVRHALGGDIDGMLAEEVVLDEDALVKIPDGMSFVDAATLPCAGVTAWNAIFESSNGIRPGDTVLLLGTGGVSILGLQLARAAGLNAIVTSSSDAKLQRAQELGARHVINYRTTPEWQEEVLRATDGAGAQVVLEVGGQGTVNRSIASAAMGGSIAIIGGVSGFGGEVNPATLLATAKRLVGIYVGSRAMLEKVVRFADATGLQPVVDRVFTFDQAREAYRHMESGSHFGKVVIAVQ